MISALLFAAAAGNFTPPDFTPEQDHQVQQSTQGKAGQSGGAVIDARVDPKGKVSDCKAVALSGDAPVTSNICGHVDGMQIEPASVSGESSYGVVRHVVGSSQVGGSPSLPADVTLQVNKLPAGHALRVVANVLVDATGKPQACSAVGDAPQAYADVACNQVAGLSFGSINDDAGKPVRYVRSVIIDFELATAASAKPPAGG
ncbi:MAG TPA: hypothetical protein VIC34_10595 [Croceibacterium sp.]|jgi:hypothetical protein